MTDVLATLAKLPRMCASRLLSDGSPIFIRRGVSGYFPAAPGFDVDYFNAIHWITPAQIEAMEAGSMFGWEVPAADPDNWKG